jgi:hypothetical protein
VRRRSSALHLAVAAFFAALLGAALAACPSRDLQVQITTAGANTLVVACESFRAACEPDAGCHLNHFLCDQVKCTLKDACEARTEAGPNPSWRPEQSMGFKLLLLQASIDSVTIENESPCFPLNLRPCIFDPIPDSGCADSGVNTDECITQAISAAVDNALAGGLTFPGFTSTDNVALVAGFYHKPGAEQRCDSNLPMDPTACDNANLMAVAGLAAPIGSNLFDITCASCQGGTHGSYGGDNAPCPVTKNACFLQRVLAALVAAGDR